MDKNKIRFLKNLSTGLVIVAMIFAFLIAGIRIFGIQVYGVLTGSMEPTYPTGSMIYVKRVDADDLRVNDVITFSLSSNVIATHRIVEIVPDETDPTVLRYRTKGDANPEADASLVSANNIIGKVLFGIPQMGYVTSFIQEPPGMYVAILIGLLMIAFVFYTDSLENKWKASFQRSNRRTYAPQNRPRTQQPVRQRTGSRQNQYPRQNGYSRQGEYPRQNGYPRQGNYPRQDGYSRQNSYSRQGGYPHQSSSSRQDGYSRQREYPRYGEHLQKNEYPRQRTSSQQRRESQSREYSHSRDSRSGRV